MAIYTDAENPHQNPTYSTRKRHNEAPSAEPGKELPDLSGSRSYTTTNHNQNSWNILLIRERI